MGNINRLYVLNTDRFDDAAEFDRAYAQMDDERKEKIDRFRYPKDKKLSLGAGYLLKTAMAGIGITDYRIERREREKPYLSGYSDVFYNLSHSGSRVALAISDKEIGVDIEEVREFSDSLINYVFSDGDLALAKELEELTGLLPDKVYTRLWTVKESIMKYSGMGIGLEPKQIELSLMQAPDGKMPGISASSTQFDCSALFLHSYELDGYQLTMCSEYTKPFRTICYTE